MNITMIGNIGNKDPVLKFSASGASYCFFSVAMNTHKKGDAKNKVIWWNCVSFKDAAESICEKFKKGDAISIIKANIELSVDSRDGKDQMQLKVWDAEKPQREGSTTGTRHTEPAPSRHDMKDEDVPF